MNVPPFADAIDVTIDGGEIVMTCNACCPPRVIHKFFGETTLNRLIAAANDHEKNRKDEY